MYAEHDVVVLTRDVPDKSLIAGDVGAVVGRYAAGATKSTLPPRTAAR